MWTPASTKSCYKDQGTVRHHSNSIFVFLSVEMTRCLYCECSGEDLQLSIVSSMLLSSQVTRHPSHPTSNKGMCPKMHTVTSHKNDKSKYLSYHQQNAIHTAVSAHPQAKQTEVWSNLKNFSPSKRVCASRLKSVGYTVQVRDTLAVIELYGTSVDDTVPSVQLFCQSAWSGDLIARHNDADDLFH